MVGDAVLRKVVGANLLRAIAASDHPFARGGQLGFALLPLDVVEARLQDFERLLPILDLRLLVLTGDDHTAGEVGDADRGVSRVDRLSART